jgi:hypothetical protein
MIHVVVMKCLMIPLTILDCLPLLTHIEFYEGVGVGDLKTVESEALCTDSTALQQTTKENSWLQIYHLTHGGKWCLAKCF